MELKRRVAVILGSKNDLKQCLGGLFFLQQKTVSQEIILVGLYVKSIHRHTKSLFRLLEEFVNYNKVDVIIAGAGMAAHLPGCVDAFLRNTLRDTKIKVIAVAFEGKNVLDDQAAHLSITQVPGTQVLYAGFGEAGFYNACLTACERPLGDEIVLKEIPPEMEMTIEQALDTTNELLEIKQ